MTPSSLPGVVSLLYAIMCHSTAGRGGEGMPSARVSDAVLPFTTKVLQVLISVASANVELFQHVMGTAGVYMEFVHVIRRLASSADSIPERVHHQLMVVVGYFAVGNSQNQVCPLAFASASLCQRVAFRGCISHPPACRRLVAAGATTEWGLPRLHWWLTPRCIWGCPQDLLTSSPVIEHLVSLPLEYFADDEFMDVLFPTLLACCAGHAANTKKLQQVVNCSMLVEYLLEARAGERGSGAYGVSCFSPGGRRTLHRRGKGNVCPLTFIVTLQPSPSPARLFALFNMCSCAARAQTPINAFVHPFFPPLALLRR